jgi:hypothetical protein
MAVNNDALVEIIMQIFDSSDSDDSSSSDSDIELDDAFRIIRRKRPRIPNYIEVIALYDDEDFKSNFR